MLFSVVFVLSSKLNSPLIIHVVSGMRLSSIHRSGQFNTQRFSTSLALRIICCLSDCISFFACVGNTSVQLSSNNFFSFSSLISISPIFVIDSFNFSLCVALIDEYDGVNSICRVGYVEFISFSLLLKN
jgi:hypothetical protein